MKYVLASASPRRQELLKKLGLNFTVHPSRCNEDCEGMPEERVRILAERKARAVAAEGISGCIIASDTLVALDDRSLGKPEDEEDAARMLRALSGRDHYVYTGVCILNTANNKSILFSEGTKVTFKYLTEEQIAEYIATGEPMDKAGAYAIQGGAGKFVESIEGSFDNVMGFPTERFSDILSGSDITDGAED